MSKRVLIVEDDDATIRTLQFALGDNGYQVATAPSGHLALGEAQVREPDVILLDLYLRGGMNGPEFLNLYRRSGGRAKVIAISGATHSDPMTQGLRVDEFIGKPLDIAQLLHSVRRFAYD
ncbi:MAG: response regulator transcription factor [Candidatus Limnocylindria bacterium]